MTRVYMLEVVYPPGVDWDHPPPNWQPLYDEQDFYFPRERKYLSKKAALAKATLLVSYGCQVTLRTSDPVTFGDNNIALAPTNGLLL